MTNIIKNFQKIKSIINNNNINIIAVTKTFSFDKIKPLFDYGHLHFGENKVQETKKKWINFKYLKPDLKLHMIGKLQKNKVKDAIKLFDYIHSLDNESLALELSKYEKLLNKKIKYFIQVNISNESQKSGIHVDNLINFYNFCKNLNLNIVGLMCIPPNDNNSVKYFSTLANKNKLLKLKELSMGMSGDFLNAIKCGATFVRIGSAIFGDRVLNN